jgi:hypothetical protein
MLANLELLSARPIMLIAGEKHILAIIQDVYKMASEPKKNWYCS